MSTYHLACGDSGITKVGWLIQPNTYSFHVLVLNKIQCHKDEIVNIFYNIHFYNHIYNYIPLVTCETTVFYMTDNFNPLISLSECLNKRIFEIDHKLSQVWIIEVISEARISFTVSFIQSNLKFLIYNFDLW